MFKFLTNKSTSHKNCGIWIFVVLFLAVFTSSGNANTIKENEVTTPTPSRDITMGPCTWVVDRKCPDGDIKFYLFTRQNMMDRQNLYIDETLEKSNLSASYFNANHPTKIVIHGYNSDMFLHPLIIMKDEYLQKGAYNIIYVDWSALSPGPCYLSAVHNTRHTGACVAQLVERILDSGGFDIHVIGFSLGAQLTNFVATNLGSFLLPRITGLDPAMPLFITSPPSEKLDPSDAAFVDVIHTNALVQAKMERCGHADFYMNGGIMQPGCYSQGSNPFACSHQRAPAYFLESIRTHKGFWGWACSSYLYYLLGMCPPTNYLVEAGENISPKTKGMFLIDTADAAPFALGKWTNLPTVGNPASSKNVPHRMHIGSSTGYDPLMQQLDEWGKLEGNFNNIMHSPTQYPQDPINFGNWPYFKPAGTDEITNNVTYDSVEDDDEQTSRVRPSVISRRKDRPVNTKFRRKQFEVVTEKTGGGHHVSWNVYRENLTAGIIDQSIFQLPRIREY